MSIREAIELDGLDRANDDPAAARREIVEQARLVDPHVDGLRRRHRAGERHWPRPGHADRQPSHVVRRAIPVIDSQASFAGARAGVARDHVGQAPRELLLWCPLGVDDGRDALVQEGETQVQSCDSAADDAHACHCDLPATR